MPAAMVSPPQVDHAKVLHYIGAGVAFPTSMLFLLLQSILTYRMAKTRGQYWTGHLRSILAAVAFLTLIFSILKGVGRRSRMGWRKVVLVGGIRPVSSILSLAARHGVRRGAGQGAEGGQLAAGVGWKSISIVAVQGPRRGRDAWWASLGALGCPSPSPALAAAAQPSHRCRLQPHTLQSGRAS